MAKNKLPDDLLAKKHHTADLKGQSFEEADAFCEGYKAFLDSGKTEREAAGIAVDMLEKAGYKPYEPDKTYKPGKKVYKVIRGRAVIAATIGGTSMNEGVHLTASHIDSPRLDLKPNPLYANEDLAYFKTHYYGGVRKYQWVAIPLSMHGVVVKKGGETVEIRYGEEPGEAQFTITDLLPHLSAEQNKRALSEGIKGEELNILIGSLPYEEKDAKDRVKLETMRILNEKYGITEKDFQRAEIEFVPALKAADIGFDRSMIGAYGQDDRVCAYASLLAEIETKNPKHTTVCILADKEEVGSDGVSGLAADALYHFLADLAEAHGANYRRLCENSKCLSADVNAAFDPTFPEPFEKRNTSFVNRGLVLSKYTGSRGKYGTSDAGAEFVAWVEDLLEAENIAWQMAEMGKVDAGGGGTVAKFVANRNIDVLDIGVPVLSMHSPFELTAKLDIYNMYRAFVAFNKA